MNDVLGLQNPKILQHLREGSLYWYGVDKCGRPILWERFDKFDWKNLDVKSKVDYYVMLFEALFAVMPDKRTAGGDDNDGDDGDGSGSSGSSIPSVQTKFSVVAETGGINYLHAFLRPSFFVNVAMLFVKAFPDRLGYFLAKATYGMTAAMKLTKPVLPASINDKIELLVDESFVRRLRDDVLLNGVDDLPDFFGGKKVHEKEIICDFGRMMEKVRVDMEDYYVAKSSVQKKQATAA